MPELYGSARLETTAADDVSGIVATSGFLGFPLGHNPHDRSRGLVFDFDRNPGHALFIGATRAGKFVNILAPALLTCAANAVVTDPKGQAAWETGPRREAMGFRCVYLDPWGEIQRRYGNDAGVSVPVSKFNPLSALDPASETFNDDVSTIADALVVVPPGQSDSHWTDSARELIAGLIAAVVELNPGKASLRNVRDLVTGTDEYLVEKIREIHERNPNSLAGRKLRRFVPKVEPDGSYSITEEISGIRSSAETQTAILDSEALLRAMETDDPPFDLAELITGKTTLYLVLPPDRLNTHGRWLRMILTLAIRTISRVGKSFQKTPCCFWLDEFSSLGNLRMVEDSFGLMAGLGVRCFAFLQDLSQIQRDYPHSWETFISNSSLVQLLQCADRTTAEYFSALLGTATVNARTGGWSYKQVQWQVGEYGRMVEEELDRHRQMLRRNMSAADLQGPSSLANAVFKNREEQLMNAFHLDLLKRLHENGKTTAYDTRWVADEQLASRPVLLPQEVREADREKSIIIMPGVGNFQLTRWEYYSDPVLSPWARHDPNRPAPTIATPAAPAPIAPPIATPPAPATPVVPPSVPFNVPPPATPPRQEDPSAPQPTVGDQLKDAAADYGKKVAGNLLRNLRGGR